eukprot:TRINITY_DN7538_c0_g2_i6.p1 TRINITY_DN7538_c0_g2~~TRINITY_DN7538_c0_g2_i6.p1  ORF type:complete len:200 (-),score=55.27 TRINITY_DN7538_c0_g2_i6:86-685(-)
MGKLVASLPYVEEDVFKGAPFLREEVQRLVNQEMAQMEKSDYLESLPFPECNILNQHPVPTDVIKSDYYRSDNIKISDEKNVEEIRRASNDVHIGLEYNNIKQMNLELQQKFGPSAWKEYISALETEKKNLEAENSKIRFQSDEINATRKYVQLQAKEKLDTMTAKTNFLIQKNEIIEKECMNIEEELREKIRKRVKLT